MAFLISQHGRENRKWLENDSTAIFDVRRERKRGEKVLKKNNKKKPNKKRIFADLQLWGLGHFVEKYLLHTKEPFRVINVYLFIFLVFLSYILCDK